MVHLSISQAGVNRGVQPGREAEEVQWSRGEARCSGAGVTWGLKQAVQRNRGEAGGEAGGAVEQGRSAVQWSRGEVGAETGGAADEQ